MHRVPWLAALLLLLSGCTGDAIIGGATPISPVDDDDATDDDDDATDDDDVTDDDDATDDDDDDDSAPDDDDATDDDDVVDPIDPEDESFVDKRFCLDWDTVVLNEPAGGELMLDIIGLTNFPLLLQPTGTDLEAGTIDMVLALASGPDCQQNLDIPASNLTDEGAGDYAPPWFSLGPLDLTLGGEIQLTATDVLVDGWFTAEASNIVEASLAGFLDVTPYAEYCEWPLTCFACPDVADHQCINLDAQDAEFFDSALGPLEL